MADKQRWFNQFSVYILQIIQQQNLDLCRDFLSSLEPSSCPNEQLVNTESTSGSTSLTNLYEYDYSGRVTKETDSNGNETTYEYNYDGLMTYTETQKGNDVYTYSDCTYLLNGLLQSVYMPCDISDIGDTESKSKYYKYDSMGRLTNEYVANAAGQPVVNRYEYDLRGNRIKMTGGQPDELITETIDYEYDLNNRLTAEKTVVNDEPNNRTDDYSAKYYYDNNGNMTAKQTIKTDVPSSTVSVSSSAALSGRSSNTGMKIYRYDAFNRLTNYNSGSVEASYTYNANNLRAGKTVNRKKTDFVWNGQNLAAETQAGTTNTYTYDMTGVHIANKDGNVTSYLKDFHGNILGRATVDGAMVEALDNRMDYDAFDNQWIGNSQYPFGYCGGYYFSGN